MSLTEKEKKRIEEEEAYRAKIREAHDSRKALSDQSVTPTKSSGGGGSGGLIVIVWIFIFLAITLIAINPAKQFESAEKAANNTQTLETKNGSFEDFSGTEYTYDIAFEEGENKYVASYSPFLQNDDRTLLMAILEAFKTVYGSNGQIVPTPILEARNGTNLIRFAGDGQNYYVLPIKEDTGEVHTLMFWKE